MKWGEEGLRTRPVAHLKRVDGATEREASEAAEDALVERALRRRDLGRSGDPLPERRRW